MLGTAARKASLPMESLRERLLQPRHRPPQDGGPGNTGSPCRFRAFHACSADEAGGTGRAGYDDAVVSVPQPFEEVLLSADPSLPSPIACSLIKLGGSLLTLPRLRERLMTGLPRLAQNPILLVGGGGLADVVREWDRLHNLPAAYSDELARKTLSITAEFVRRLLPGSEIVGCFREAALVLASGGWPLIDVSAALADPLVAGLPKSWDVTSDSMAAVIATGWRLGELILVKSTACPLGTSCENAAIKGLVDQWFPEVVDQSQRVRWCDGRYEPWRGVDWLGGEGHQDKGILSGLSDR